MLKRLVVPITKEGLLKSVGDLMLLGTSTHQIPTCCHGYQDTRCALGKTNGQVSDVRYSARNVYIRIGRGKARNYRKDAMGNLVDERFDQTFTEAVKMFGDPRTNWMHRRAEVEGFFVDRSQDLIGKSFLLSATKKQSERDAKRKNRGGRVDGRTCAVTRVAKLTEVLAQIQPN